jgi:hypothetical protein
MTRCREQAIELMTRFAERTGLAADRPQQRYLWTDAFAVCDFLGLGHGTGDARFTELSLGTARRVHEVLGHHRADDRRTGWISGLSEEEGQAHPTRGGLRIGKPLPERHPDEPIDERREWDRDGQYFHYLTKWMHALDQVARSTGQAMFNQWARELALVSHSAFTHVPLGSSRPRMYWKLSVDLSRPLVVSMGSTIRSTGSSPARSSRPARSDHGQHSPEPSRSSPRWSTGAHSPPATPSASVGCSSTPIVPCSFGSTSA